MLDITTDVTPADEDKEERSPISEAPSVWMASGMFAPFAMMAESQMMWRRSMGLAKRWGDTLRTCRNTAEIIEVNREFGEKAIALGYSEAWRVMERSALMGRMAVAPKSLQLRDADEARLAASEAAE